MRIDGRTFVDRWFVVFEVNKCWERRDAELLGGGALAVRDELDSIFLNFLIYLQLASESN